ncbi:hypothetical protein [Streptosporangium sp. NPDC000396]
MTLLNRLGIAAALAAAALVTGSLLTVVHPDAPPAPDRVAHASDSGQR